MELRGKTGLMEHYPLVSYELHTDNPLPLHLCRAIPMDDPEVQTPSDVPERPLYQSVL